jgi:hypothetical protein
MIKLRTIRRAGHAARMRKKRNTYRILVRKSEGKRPLGRPKCRWVDNMKTDLREVGWGGVDWIDLAQDIPVEGCCEHDNKPSGSIILVCWNILE